MKRGTAWHFPSL